MDERTWATLIVTDRTIEEYMTTLEATGKDPNKDPQDEPFWQSFRKLHNSNASLTWEGFKLKLSNISELLSTEFGVKIDKIHYKELKNSQEVQKLVGPVVTSALPRLKSDKVAEHDAFHLALVRKLSEGEEGVSSWFYWFLTEDYSLERAEWSLGAKIYAVPPDIWLQIISPFLSPIVDGGASEVFVRILNSQLGSFALRVDDRQLVKWLMPWADSAGFTEDQWKRILTNNYVQEHLGRVRSSLPHVETGSVGPDAAALAGVVLKELSNQQKEESEKLNQRIQSLSERLGEKDEQINQAKRHFKLAFVVLASVLSVAIDLILYAYLGLGSSGATALTVAVPCELIFILEFPALLAWINAK
jgi:hypothetical protein